MNNSCNIYTCRRFNTLLTPLIELYPPLKILEWRKDWHAVRNMATITATRVSVIISKKSNKVLAV